MLEIARADRSLRRATSTSIVGSHVAFSVQETVNPVRGGYEQSCEPKSEPRQPRVCGSLATLRRRNLKNILNNRLGFD